MAPFSDSLSSKDRISHVTEYLVMHFIELKNHWKAMQRTVCMNGL